jgi:uncharacterized protein YndB with AHSA1/START domain
VQEQRASRLVRATKAAVYAALLDAEAVETWRVPDDMVARVEEWEPVEGGRFRVSLSYRDPGRAGKTSGATDTYAGRFVRLVPGEQVVERLAFETEDPALADEMTMTVTLREVDGGTEVELFHQGLPDAVPAEDNAAGTRMALAKLAALVEGRSGAGEHASAPP